MLFVIYFSFDSGYGFRGFILRVGGIDNFEGILIKVFRMVGN